MSEPNAKTFQVFDSPLLSLAQIQVHFDAHPELWDKNHPDYGMPVGGIVQRDYISLLPLVPLTAAEKQQHEKFREMIRDFAKTHPITFVIPKAPPLR